MRSNWGVLYTIGNILLKAIRYCPQILKKKLICEKYECPNFLDKKSPDFGTLTWKSDIWI